MNDEHLLPEEPTAPVPYPPAPPTPTPAKTPDAPSHLGHIVAGALLVLIGVGWLLEALDVADVPWRYFLPAALVVVGVALVFGARTGSHGGLIAVGVALSVLVLLAGALDVLADIPFTGRVGETTQHPTAAVDDQYRWGVGKMTLDLRDAANLTDRQIEASVMVGELIVIVPPDITFRVVARSGIGEVTILGKQSGGLDTQLECLSAEGSVNCDDGSEGPPMLDLDLRVAVGRVEVQR